MHAKAILWKCYIISALIIDMLVTCYPATARTVSKGRLQPAYAHDDCVMELTDRWTAKAVVLAHHDADARWA